MNALVLPLDAEAPADEPPVDRAEAERRRVARRNRRKPSGPPHRTVPLEELRLQVAAEPRRLAVVRQRPKTRADCVNGPRPCPWVSCRHNLYLEVSPIGSVVLNWPGLEPDQMPPTASCALDLADDGPHTLEAVAEVLNLTRERVRQIFNAGAEQLKRSRLAETEE